MTEETSQNPTESQQSLPGADGPSENDATAEEGGDEQADGPAVGSEPPSEDGRDSESEQSEQRSEEAERGDQPSEARPQTPGQKLVASLSDIKDELQERVRDLNRAKKALEQICRSGAIENLELVQKYTGWLEGADLQPIEMDEQRVTAVDRLTTYVERRKRERRMRFLRGLDQGARQRDIRFEKLSETPLTVRLHPFTVEADFEANEATLSFARSEIETVELDPMVVLETRQQSRERMLQAAVASERFFERLHRAYEAVIRARDAADGERVDLVDLLGPLALYNSDVDTWRGGDLDAIAPYPPHLLAFQLVRLRRDGMLEHDGRRIDLGTATGGSTADKDDVLFIPAGRGEGQYYLSIRFRTAD